jgi:hypothetical protein
VQTHEINGTLIKNLHTQLAKQDQVPFYYVVTYVKQEHPVNNRRKRRGSWRDHVAPSWLCTVSTFERSPTGILLEQSTSTIRSFELNFIHDEKTRREGRKER